MKTAEEWIRELLNTNTKKGINHPYFAIIKTIQLDAWKQGMSDAIKLADTCKMCGIISKQNIILLIEHELSTRINI